MEKIIVPGKEILIPRVVVRPLLPPPPAFGARLQPQHLHWQVGRYKERLTSGPGGLGRGKVWVVEKEAEQHNLILNQTYDSLMAQYDLLSLARYAVVGTGSTPPDPTQTGLVSEVARQDYGRLLPHALVSDHVYDISATIEFPETKVGGRNLTEWGFSPVSTPGNNLMVRELFRDGSGNPVVLTLDTDQRLRLIYKYRVSFSPNTAQDVSININGLGVKTGRFILVRGEYPNFYHLLQMMGEFMTGVSVQFRVLSAFLPLSPSDTSGYNGTQNFSISYQTYTSGSRTRKTQPLTIPNTEANIAWATFGLGRYVSENNVNNQVIARFVFNSGQEFTKNDLYKITIGEWVLTWGP